MRPLVGVRCRAQRLLERLDHFGLAFEDEHVRTPDRADVQRLVAGIQDQDLFHGSPKTVARHL
jgi:hypothetical protein